MRRMAIVLSFACGIMLTGCAGIKNIQDLTYIVAIGMDYDEEKEEYVVYLQGLNFANVAKQEGGKPAESIPIFVAAASGETLNLAVSKLYRKSEPPLFFGHVKTLVLSQHLLKNKSKEVLEEIGRNRSFRPTLRVVTTEEAIQEVFNVNALFNYPAIYTVLYIEKTKHLAQDEIKPSTLMDFLREYHEPMGTAKLPSVKIDKDSWVADQNYPVLFFNGYSVFEKQEYVREIPFDDAVYINWLLEKNISLDQRVEVDGELVAAVKLANPKMKIKYNKSASAPAFSIEISTSADLLEKLKDLPLDKFKKLMEEDIKAKVENIYQAGVENKLDLLNVGEKWFRQHPKKYHELNNSKQFYLQKNSLTDVKVDVEVLHFNSYKYEKKG
jgi:Ger(x)C family germination protein